MNWYYALGRFLSPAALVLFRLYSRIYPRSRPRVMVVKGNEILLVKSVFGTQKWELPGGANKRGEESQKAAARELYEETGIAVQPESLEYVMTLYGRYEAPIFKVEFDSSMNLRINVVEIAAHKWMAFDEQLTDVTPMLHLLSAKLPKKR